MFNKLFDFTQKKFSFIYDNSLILQNIDNLILVSILLVFIASTFLASDYLGFLALVTVFLSFIKILVVPNERLDIKRFEIFLLAYFIIVIISLMGSTFFVLSLKGFLKTLIYLGFYVSVVQYLKDNKNRIPLIFTVIGLCVAFEAVVGILQNFAKVSEISTWQDVSKLNPEQIMTRVYGTLKPLNPNLLGGYFVAGIPILYSLSAYCFSLKKYLYSGIGLILAIISSLTLFLTGCRGSYIGMFVIFLGIFAISAKYLWKNYKNIYLLLVAGVFALGTSTLLLISSLRTRVLSIFAMRQDSSNSFRFNVYQSSFEMFKDNWLLGIGIGNQNFREIYGLYMKTGFDALSAYNIFLEIAVESGIFALIAFVLFLTFLIKDGVVYLIKQSNDSGFLLAGALISVCAVCVHGFVDTVFFRPQIQFLFWLMIAICRILIYQTRQVELS